MRNHLEIHSQFEPLTPPQGQGNPAVWLMEHASDFRWVLAHADDGIIWGEIRNGALHLASQAFPAKTPGLRWETLQQLRLFGEYGELRLWRRPAGWSAGIRRDGMGAKVDALDEQHLLWGTMAEATANSFQWVRESGQIISYALPISTAPTPKRRAALKVRHYLDEDPHTGLVRIANSRLVALLEPKEMNQ